MRIVQLLLLVLVLLPSAVHAKDLAEQIAAKAQKTHQENCAEAAGAGAESDAALATAEVGAVWAEVALVHEETGATWLLYWRGLLAQCIGQTERAADALTEFVQSDASVTGMDAMVRDARKRLKRLRPGGVPPKRATPAKVPRPPPSPEQRARSGRVVGGIVLAMGAVGVGVGSGVGFSEFSSTRTTLTTQVLLAADSDSLITRGDGQIAASVGLAIGAGFVAVASIAAFAGASRLSPQVAVLAVPLPDGAGLVLGGRW